MRLLFLLPGFGFVNTEKLGEIVAVNDLLSTVVGLLRNNLNWGLEGIQCLSLIACVDDRRYHRVCLRSFHSLFNLLLCACCRCFTLVFVKSFAVFDFGMGLLGLI